MWAFIKGSYRAIAGCAVAAGLAVGLIDDLRHFLVDRAVELVRGEQGLLDICLDRHFKDTPRPASGVFNIVLTVPRGDTDKSQFFVIDRSLSRLLGEDADQAITHEAIDCPPLMPSSGVKSDAIASARHTAEDILHRAQADLVIWGDVLLAGEALELRFEWAGEDRASDYAIDRIVLETTFGKDIGSIIAAKALTRTSTTIEQQGAYLARRMERALDITRPLVSDMPEGLGWEARGSLYHSHASALYWVGLQPGRSLLLIEAVAAFEDALKEHTRDRVPLNWARTKMNLGNALRTLGGRESGTERLEAAVVAYEDALKEYTRERVPLDWATTKNNLGNALRNLGARESGTERLEAAVAAYEDALKEWTRDRVPQYWAITQFNLGGVEIAFLEKTRDPVHLDRAETHVRAAREVFLAGGVSYYIDWMDRVLAHIASLRP